MPSPDDKESKVRKRAYELWESEGKPHGRDIVHWLRAETELSKRLHAPCSTPAVKGGTPVKTTGRASGEVVRTKKSARKSKSGVRRNG